MAKGLPLPPNVRALLGTYVDRAGTSYRAEWQQGRLHLRKLSPTPGLLPGTFPNEPFAYDEADFRRHVERGSFTRSTP